MRQRSPIPDPEAPATLVGRLDAGPEGLRESLFSFFSSAGDFSSMGAKSIRSLLDVVVVAEVVRVPCCCDLS